MATLGGNLLQRPRCWYFRDRHIPCWLKGGADCPAREGENQLHAVFPADPCVAVHPSDPATALVALDAAVHVRGERGERRIPAEEFFAEPTDTRRVETVLQDDELITAIYVPGVQEIRSSYVKAMDRKVWAFALAAAAARLGVSEGRITSARVVLGGVAITPHRARAVEQMLIRQAPTDALYERAAEAALDGARPLAHNGYKLPLVRGLVRQLLETVLSGSRSM
jgi:xanthine dehydrogenase YagS FAD-binding subunit